VIIFHDQSFGDMSSWNARNARVQQAYKKSTM